MAPPVRPARSMHAYAMPGLGGDPGRLETGGAGADHEHVTGATVAAGGASSVVS